jgi:hypothetical protein
MLSFKLFGLVFCLFRLNRNIKSLCFGIEAKQPKQTVSKQTENNRKKPEKTLNFLKKYQNMFRYRSETTEKNVLFRIVPKLVAVVRIETSFEGHPTLNIEYTPQVGSHPLSPLFCTG